ncbi:hypothetical protein SASPL_102684 [Salvia splendens]|uniref:Uncharacterized protein n=1 Tax=Salvia splendens TaxID=180675 RepID=A0A8X9AE28_SALSN|nr:uncharacterized protein LOC121751475 [Salvia splendens]KAG6437756.1 hypothetical protein SASPL_102684 [Salvia splendens]
MEPGSDRLALISGRIQSLPPLMLLNKKRQPLIHCYQMMNLYKKKGRSLLSLTSRWSLLHSAIMAATFHLNQWPYMIVPMKNHLISHHPHNKDYQPEHTLFTPDQIRSAVAASENTRMFCSIAAAVLVIASFVGVPIVGLLGIILFRPFYLLLLTNITVVLGRLIVGSRSRRRSNAGRNDLADQLGRALELGLLMKKIVGAVSMDFSIYAVVQILW